MKWKARRLLRPRAFLHGASWEIACRTDWPIPTCNRAKPEVLAKRLLARAADPNRPLPTVTFADRYTLRVGAQTLELSYHGNAHEPGNIFIHAPARVY